MKNIILIGLVFIIGLGMGVAGSMLMRPQHKPYYRMKHRVDLSEDEKNKIKTLCDLNNDDEDVMDKDYHPAPRPPEDAPMSHEKDDLPPPPESL